MPFGARANASSFTGVGGGNVKNQTTFGAAILPKVSMAPKSYCEAWMSFGLRVTFFCLFSREAKGEPAFLFWGGGSHVLDMSKGQTTFLRVGAGIPLVNMLVFS